MVELLTGDEQVAAPAEPPTAPVGRPPGLRDRLRDSYWIAWTFTFLLNWVAFIWIGLRARSRRWIAWGVVYAIAPVVAMAAPADSTAFDVAVAALLVLGPVSILHAFAIRRTYIARRRARIGGEPEPVEPPSPELDAPLAGEQASPQGLGGRGLGGRLFRGLESLADPCHVERARALLDEGRRREALAVLEQGLPAAKRSVARDWYYSDEPDQDLGDGADPALEELAAVRALALEVVDESRWGSWDAELVAGFEALATAAEREAEEVRADALGRAEAKHRGRERRRFEKAFVLCLATPLLVFLSVGFSAPEGSPDPSTLEVVLAFVVLPVIAAALSALATRRLWRRQVTSSLLYAPFCVGYLAAGVAACAAIY